MKPTKPPSSDNQTRSLSDPSNRPVHQAETINPTPAVARATVSLEKAAQPPSASGSASWLLQPEQRPATFGRYQLMRLLGKGGMGTVYLAHDTQLDRQVALKIPQFSATDGPSVMERFFREARAAATLHHANICPVHDVGEVNGTHYLTMAYIEGRSLFELIHTNTKGFSLRQSAALVRKLGLALEEAHNKKVIHRDLKPSNVMLTRRGEPVIMDFGLARRGGVKDAPLTQYGSVMGTPAYMAPEQARGNPDEMGPACDIYSLGVILYELLAGRPPFEGDGIAILSQLLMDEPKAPSKFRPDLDRKLEAICLKAIAKRPERRYRTMGEFAGALGDYLKGTGQPAPGGSAGNQPATETPLRELLRDLEAPPGAGAKPAPDFHIGQLSRRRSETDLHQAFDLEDDVPAIPRTRHKGRRLRLSPRVWIIGAAGIAALLLIGIVILWQTEHDTIQAERNDANAKSDVKIPVPRAVPRPEELTEPPTASQLDQSGTASEAGSKLPATLDTTTSGTSQAATKNTPPAGKPDRTTAKQSLPRDRWIQLDANTPAASWVWKNNKRKSDQQKWENGVLTLENRGIAFNSIKGKDISFRAQVKFIEGNNMALRVRVGSKSEIYALFGRLEDGRTNIAVLNTKHSKVLPRKNGFFEFRVTTIGNKVTIQVNGETVIEYRQTEKPESGHVEITAYDARGMFKDMEVKILDK